MDLEELNVENALKLTKAFHRNFKISFITSSE